MSRPLYIFDLDGTLALIEHRRHHVSKPDTQPDGDKEWKPNWKAFYAACVHDQPNAPVIQTLRMLVSAGADIWVFSGRSDEVVTQTLEWLQKHIMWGAKTELILEMRTEGDYTPDDQLKLKWLKGMLVEDRARLIAVFEDRDRMVKMWRENGVACFQVAPGEF
jgi:hypothetical protein